MSPAPRKIAVLGGGVGALTTALALSSLPGWQERFEITVYQLGWRLGGKGASGRNRDHYNRIEEHGIHLWLGYYENAFRLMRACYADNARPLSAPLATWDEAFKPHNCHVMEDPTSDGMEFWPVEFSPPPGTPGDGSVPSHWEVLCSAVEGMLGMFRCAAARPHSGSPSRLFSGLERFLCGLVEASVLEAGEQLLAEIERLLRTEGRECLHSQDWRDRLVDRLDGFLQWLWRLLEKEVAQSTPARRLWLLLDFSIANLRGYLADDVLHRGFSALDGIDYRDWLRQHGASEITLHSQAVNWAYNFMLHDRSTMAAGVMLQVMSRAMLTCKSAIYWKLQAGMGDVVFAPMYEVLNKRGVRFRFFHRVRNLSIADDGQSIGAISLGRQATVTNGEYQPLFDVRGLPCWPSSPLYEQLVEGEKLRAKDINLESWWTPWQDVEEITLRRGTDFDDVVLGISLAAIPGICTELIERKPEWKAMVDRVTTTATQSFQVWTYPDAAGLGFPAWQLPAAVLLTSAEPINSWADMSDILLKEEWPGELSPNQVGYLCGVSDAGLPPPTEYGFPAAERERLKGIAIQYLNEHAGGFWPAAHLQSGFDWSLLADRSDATGEARLDSQYLRVNIDPSERYVLSAAGTMQYRIDPENTGFANLFLAGDWVKTPLNAGCVEGAVMGGLAAARAIAGSGIEIVGEDFAAPQSAKAEAEAEG
ncbi:MAG: NAD(P)-binding protein [Acidobacteriaceae bacterium]